MIDYIPSKAVKKYMEFKNIHLTDFEKASLIYNAEKTCNLASKHDVLREIMDNTQDRMLKQQIAERLEEDENILSTFIRNQNGAIYKVQTYDENGKNAEEQYFTSFKTASESVKEYMEKVPPLWQEYQIEKFLLYREGEKPVIGEDTWDESCLGIAFFNLQGEMTYLDSLEYESKIDTCDVKRFEKHYLSLRTPFRAGDIVKNITTGRYGVVWLAGENHEKLDRLAREGNADFSDAAICVEYLYDDGDVCHDHPYPWELEYTHLQFEYDILSPNIMEAMLCSMSPILQGNGYIEIMLDYSRKMLRLDTKETDSVREELEHHYEHFVHSEKYDEILLKHFATLEPEVS